MVGHRSVLTAAHCISSNGSSVTKAMRVAPAGRGIDYAGNRSPFGNRYVEWYTWPNGWNGNNSNVRYDYAILRLTDINWSPGYVRFGHQTTTWLDYKNYNTAGYPAESHSCADSPLDSGSHAGKCAGYMYRQYAAVTAVGASGMWHQHDISPGQSGSPLYILNGNDRVIYGVVHGGTQWDNLAHRIRSGSYGLICSAVNAAPSSYFSNPSC